VTSDAEIAGLIRRAARVEDGGIHGLGARQAMIVRSYSGPWNSSSYLLILMPFDKSEAGDLDPGPRSDHSQLGPPRIVLTTYF
jgi:hypothetical protein